MYPANFTQYLRYNVAAAITGSYRFVSLSHSRDHAPASHKRLRHITGIGSGMVKTLSDCCLQCIATNLRILNRPGVYLTRAQKEILLERMCWNDGFTKENLPAISYNLLSDNLYRINLSYSDKITDDVMKLLFSCKCTPKWLTIHSCKKITSESSCMLSSVYF